MAAENRNAPLGQRHDWPRVEVAIAPLGLPGTLVHSAAGQHIVLFAHSSGSSRLVAERLALTTEWVRSGELRDVPIGYFGASTGPGAALVAETLTDHRIAAIVSRGGGPDLAGAALPRVRAATLLTVGGSPPLMCRGSK
jgi:putative phosphoribosyl transferase